MVAIGMEDTVRLPAAPAEPAIDPAVRHFLPTEGHHPGILLSSSVEGRPTGEPNRFQSFDSGESKLQAYRNNDEKGVS